jgi:hypothetical protein
LKSCFEQSDYDQYISAMTEKYLDHAVLPGECFYYNKATLFQPNWPREVIEFVRPQAFQEVLKCILNGPGKLFVSEDTAPKKNAQTSNERAIARCREIAIATSSIAAASRDCSSTIKNSFVSYSQFECYGKEQMKTMIVYPAIFKMGSVFVLMKKPPELTQRNDTVYWCRDIITAIYWIIYQLGENGNERAALTRSSWEK